jgi:drug/metabolite transporter (DMT)-like permease
VVALTGSLLPYFFISWGTVHIASGMSGILMAIMPLIVVVLAHFLLPDEPLTLTKILGFLIGLAGVIVLLGPERLAGLESAGPGLWGQLSVIAGAVCYALTAIIGRRMPARPPLETAAITSAIAGVIGLAGAVAFEPHGLAGATTESWLVLVILGIFPTALAALVYFALLTSAGATFLSYINYLIPVFATGVGIMFMGESFGTGAFLGLALVLAGIAVSRARWRRGVRI